MATRQLGSFNFPDHFIRHRNAVGELTPLSASKGYVFGTFDGGAAASGLMSRRRVLVKGKEIEEQLYPRAAAIFANRHNQYVWGKARSAHHEYLICTRRRFGRDRTSVLKAVGKKIRVNPQRLRGLENIEAYIQLGSCLERNIPPFPP